MAAAGGIFPSQRFILRAVQIVFRPQKYNRKIQSIKRMKQMNKHWQRKETHAISEKEIILQEENGKLRKLTVISKFIVPSFVNFSYNSCKSFLWD